MCLYQLTTRTNRRRAKLTAFSIASRRLDFSRGKPKVLLGFAPESGLYDPYQLESQAALDESYRIHLEAEGKDGRSLLCHTRATFGDQPSQSVCDGLGHLDAPSRQPSFEAGAGLSASPMSTSPAPAPPLHITQKFSTMDRLTPVIMRWFRGPVRCRNRVVDGDSPSLYQ